VAGRHHQDGKPVVLDRGNDAVIPHAVAPQALQVVDQRASEAARVFGGRDALAQIGEDQAPRRRSQLAQIARRIRVELDAPKRRFLMGRCGLLLPGTPNRVLGVEGHNP